MNSQLPCDARLLTGVRGYGDRRVLPPAADGPPAPHRAVRAARRVFSVPAAIVRSARP
ncbi:hypothetical protein SBRY_20580 [Actinacidiphila bryophytorum]|uniref:Uncharacterized protein n=1 Tax=Actinacidiphila bryophytorum TaxID=1436133 RepID=A0A9W4GZH6_9ACTN|nr:hypothetical protein SBRY_20580 [Actinacidiphila bryophytorum]